MYETHYRIYLRKRGGKTDKWYQDKLRGGIASASKVIVDVLKKYGKEKYRTYIPAKSDNHGDDCRIDGFGLTDKGEVYLDIYWQGDSTDGNDEIFLSELMRYKTVKIPALRGAKYMKHGKLEVEYDWLDSAFKSVADYIDHKNEMSRNSARDKEDVINDFVKEFDDFYSTRVRRGDYYSDLKYDAGMDAAKKYVEKNWKDLMKETKDDRLRRIYPAFYDGYTKAERK